MQIVIDISEDDYRKVQDGRASVSVMRKAIRNGTPIPDNASNRDVMKIIFPKIGLYDEWYDEPYQKGRK